VAARACRFSSSGKIGREEQPCLWSNGNWKPCLSTVFFLALFLPLSLSLFLSCVKQWLGPIGRMNCFRRKAISANSTWARTVKCLPDLIFGETTVITPISSCYTTCVLFGARVRRFNVVIGGIGMKFLRWFNRAFTVDNFRTLSCPFYFFGLSVRDILKQRGVGNPAVVVIFCKFPEGSF